MIPQAPSGPHHQGRRQQEHPHHYQHHYIPPQTHSPVHHNPYAYHPQHYAPPHHMPYGQPMPQMAPQWYNPYAQPMPPQYMMPPRPFQPQGSPVVVSSHMAQTMMPTAPVHRGYNQTPPIVHSRTPPAPRVPTPHTEPAPSTPSVASHVACYTPTTDIGPAPTPPLFTTPSRPPQSPPQPKASDAKEPIMKLPWLSVPDEPFPSAAAKRRKRRTALVSSTEEGLALPAREQAPADETVKQQEEVKAEEPKPVETKPAEVKKADGEEKADSVVAEDHESQTSTLAAGSTTDTPSTSHPISPVEPTHATNPPSRSAGATHKRTATIPAVPLVPIKSAKPASVTSTAQKSAKTTAAREEPKKAEATAPATTETGAPAVAEGEKPSEESPKAASPPKPAAPKSWAELLRSKAAPAATQAPAAANGVVTNGSTGPKSNTLADALATFSVYSDKKVSFLEPRGLVNSGNLCYMNSILQVLLFCSPFYGFLDQVSKRAAHSFKSETPLIDAMIMFMRDFKVIDSAVSAEQLRLRLKDTELEQYGDPLAPEYVYDVIRRLPRFENMKRGQQEDAEEFLGFLLAGLHDECAHVIKTGRRASVTADGVKSPKSDRSGSVDNGWLEVGPKQKASVTQSSGVIDVETPVTKIFGGKLRSEYKKPGEKPSVTLEPYQPLQLDIGSPEVHNISDALRGLTHLETLESATRGGKPSTKQVFIDTLPQVLILHLKRFHYDANGPHKIWKKVGYPLDLEIPKEVFPPHVRGSFGARGGLPRYRLTGVVYHHGKNASGGHYTVDLRRQDNREWIRMDDTVIRRVRSEDVAEGGAEEDPKVLAAALEQHKKDAGSGRSRNFYELGDEAEKADEGGWSKVNGAEKKGAEKKWSGVVNGTATPASAGKRTPLKDNVKDNKVAYILFYQRVEA